MTEASWWEHAIRAHADEFGPAGESWNISAVLDRLRAASPTVAPDEDAKLARAREQYRELKGGDDDMNDEFEAALADAPCDSGMDGETVARAEWLWANLPTGNRTWAGLATHEKALVCHTLARLHSTPREPDDAILEEAEFLCERLRGLESELKDDGVADEFYGHVHPSLTRLRNMLTASPRSDVLRRYHELIFAVSKKYEGEDRHETALRYIREREADNEDRPIGKTGEVR